MKYNKKQTYVVMALFIAVLASSANAMIWRNDHVATLQMPDDSIQTIQAPPPPLIKGNGLGLGTPNVVDEVVWVVGDEAILRSDIESMRLQGEAEGVSLGDNPDCYIPEQLAVQKLFLHQAAIDSLEVTEAEVLQSVDQQINYWISLIGSKEQLEAYRKRSVAQMRQDLHDDFKNRQLINKMQEKLVEDIEVSPHEVREYFRNLPADSIPTVPTVVEVEIITRTPLVPPEETERVKNQLRDFTDRVTKGETSFSALARLYSEDPGSARQGGELGFMGRGMLDPAFAAVAFNLTDPAKVSKIVESEFGYHIIQLIDKRGDKVNVRHILMKPKVDSEQVAAAIERLDTVASEIRAGKYTFEDAAAYVSDDKDTRLNHGLMANANETGRTSKFELKDLPQEIAAVVDTMQVGEVSKAFKMVNSRGKTVCAIVKLKSKVDSHKASITEDFQTMRDIVLEERKAEKLQKWVAEKLKNTYVRIGDSYRDCNFEYQGWVK